ncbi:Indolepyruvate oxidoreductase subunit IorB [Mucinivorans hirudinis]|uniref:Indolepyruvate oxidoreductase subunit IorB n=1 Tax=Mucinivorans hirudinis TaxID=1433126 RepID=A0A060RD81_9BACT|nr:Indolepyruvate oxidoreductase subunit IorB [Mucinivorans hirudinis]
MKLDIILSGVGGQGILSIAAIIAEASLRAGLNIKQAEVHGMSQRGGDVQSHLRISSEEIFSDLIPRSQADVIIALEPMEALRYVPFLSANGWIISNTAPFKNIVNYPPQEHIINELASYKNSILLNVDDLARENGVAKGANMVLLGAASLVLGIDYEQLDQSIRNHFSPKGEEVVRMNLKALELGKDSAVNMAIKEVE